MLSRKWTCFFIFLCVLSLYQATLAQDSDEDVFAQVFGKKAKPVSVVSPVVLDGIPLGTVDVVAEGENFLIDKKKLIGLVEKKLRPKIVDQIRALSGEKLKVSDLAVPGLKVRYDEDNLALRIDITPEARETNVVSFRGPPSLAKREVIHRPSLISGYLNTRVNRQWDHPDFLDQFVEGPLLVDLEGVVNFNDWVLQAQWDMNSDNQEKWQRKDVRLTRDHPAQATRYSFGDIEYALLGFQNFRALGGFSLAKNYSLQPYLVTSPVGRNKLFLKRRSTVRIFVNGRFLRELELDAGEHDLRDLPLVRGVNEVQVEVEDDLGKKERLIFPFVSEAELLRQGLHQYGYNFGAPFDEIGGDRSYDGSRLTYSFFHRYGLFNSTTVGVYSQGDDRQKLYGTELVWGSSIGLIALDTAMSQVEGFDNDYAARLRYRYLEDSAGSRFAKNFGFNVEYTGQSFGALGTTNPNNSVETAFDISYSQSLLARLRGSISYSHQLAREGFENEESVSLNFNYFGLQGHQFTLDLRQELRGGSENETEVFFSWLWTGDNPKNFLLTSYNSPNQAVSSEYQHSGYIGNTQYDASANAAKNEDQESVGFDFDLSNNRMIFLSSHERFFPKEEGLFNGARSRLTFGTALAFSGTKFTFSRPITDSFALISAKPHLYGQEIPINPQGDYAEAEIGGFFKTTVLPNLTSYHYEPINLDTSRLEPGYQLGEENFVVLPSFRSGSSVIVGTDATVFITGRLLDTLGRPVSLQAGELYPPREGRLKEPVTFFTNRKGEFRVEGLIPGEFTMKLYDESWQPAQVRISSEKVGIVSVGDIVVRSSE